MSILCTICMRGGSKGLKNKAIKKINKKPLFYYTLNTAKKTKLFDKIVISTDSNKIIQECEKYKQNIFFKRPASIAKDYTPKIEVIRDLLKRSENYYNKKFSTIIDLDITSPLRNISDVINAYKLFIRSKSDNLFSVTNSKKNPYFNVVEYKENRIKLIKKNKVIIARQKAPKVYDMNASIYIWKRNILLNKNSLFLKNTSIYKMPEERSIDIDSLFDFKIVKFLIESNEK